MSVELFPFQKEDVQFALGKPGFLNANDMGTGKTYETLAEMSEGYMTSALIVCPNSVKSTWETAIPQFFPTREVLTLSGSTKRRIDEYGTGFLIVNWEALRTMPQLQVIEWDWIVADEAHKAKNRKAKQTRYLKRLRTTFKRALTGTPVVNRPDELWSILNWLYPKEFRSYWRFFEEFVEYEIGYPGGYKIVTGYKNLEKLHAILEPIMCRRLKEDVLPDLPDKYYTTLKVDLLPKQRRAYDAMKNDSLAWLEMLPEDKPLPAPSVLAQLTRLRQFASGYCEIEAPNVMQSWADASDRKVHVVMTEPSSKLDALMELLDDTDEQVVVFTQFKQLAYLAAERMRAVDISVTMFTGDTPDRMRRFAIDDFVKGRTRVFLATAQAGGLGIDGLQVASTVIFLDRSWSPATNIQAEDRLWRHGQENAVHVIDIAANDTVDQVVEEKLALKRSWMKAILGDK